MRTAPALKRAMVVKEGRFDGVVAKEIPQKQGKRSNQVPVGESSLMSLRYGTRG